jgi:Ca2+-binding RTX toxin-like protein
MRRVGMLLAAMALALLLTSGVAWAVNKVGTNGPDTLRGTNRADNLLGRGGNDDIFGLAGSDNLLGGAGKDVILGGNERFRLSGGDLKLVGGSGKDWVIAGTGSDNVLGGRGNDLLVDDGLREFSEDKLSGGPGNDVIDVFHHPAAAEDVIVCGSGFDRVIADRADLVAPDCEKVVVVHGSLEDIFRQAERFNESIPESFFRGLPGF